MRYIVLVWIDIWFWYH